MRCSLKGMSGNGVGEWIKVCFGDVSVYRLGKVKKLGSKAFKSNCVKSCFSHFTAYSCVVC